MVLMRLPAVFFLAAMVAQVEPLVTAVTQEPVERPQAVEYSSILIVMLQ